MQYSTPHRSSRPFAVHTHAQVEFQTLLSTYIDESASDKKRHLRLAHCIELLENMLEKKA